MPAHSETTPPAATARAQVLPLSAHSAEALAARAADLEQHLGEHPAVSLAAVARTLQTGHPVFAHRRAIVAATVEEARAALTAAAPAGTIAQSRSLVFMFPGQGSQYAGMARGLSPHPLFRETLDRCLDLINARLGTDLREVLFAEPADGDRLRQTQYAQPALFAVEYSLATLLMTWLGRPAALIGHSVGEYAAACLAGIFSLDDAVSLVVERGRLMQSMPPGSMLAVAASESDVSAYLDADIALAAVNAPEQCVISGPADAISALDVRLSDAGMLCHPLRTSHAFHSASMDAAAAALAERVAKVTRRAPAIPVISNVNGQALSAADAQDPEYWARQLRATVRFADGIRGLLEREGRLLCEVGPGAALCGLARRNSAFGAAHVAVSTLRQDHEDRSDEVKLLEAVGQAWVRGADVNWRALL